MMESGFRTPTESGASAPIAKLAAALVLAIGLAVCAFPHLAWAKFNDVTDSYPASQEVSTSGDVLSGADVPEGTYAISAQTSSYMCKMSNVVLRSDGGGLFATFQMSKAYNALYWGTAEEAAAQTNADGTDYSAYYTSDPLEGYVERTFTIPVAALNAPLTLATFSGGSKGIDAGMWYTRTVVFSAGSDVNAAVDRARNGGSPAAEPGDGKSGGSQVKDSDGPGAGAGDDIQRGDDEPGGSGDEKPEDGTGGDPPAADNEGPNKENDDDGPDSPSVPGSDKPDSADDSKKPGSESRSRPGSGDTGSASPAGQPARQPSGAGTPAGAGAAATESDAAAAESAPANATTQQASIRGIGLSFASADAPASGQVGGVAGSYGQAEGIPDAVIAAAIVISLVNVALVAALVFGARRLRPARREEIDISC